MKINNLNFKIFFFYLFLSFLNIIFLSTMLYENQVDLIRENAQYKATYITHNLVYHLEEINQVQLDKKTFIEKTKNLASKVTKNFTLFTEEGEILYSSANILKMNKSHLLAAINSITNKDFNNKKFYIKIDEKKYEISFYIPLKNKLWGNTLLLFNYNLNHLSKSFKYLYNQVLIIIGIIVFFHFLFGLYLYRVLILPIKKLNSKSKAISKGKLSERIKLSQNDEIGNLAKTFNKMAASIEEKIDILEEHNHILNFERSLIEKIHDIITPHHLNNNLLKCFTHFSNKNSYYDVIPLKNGFGIIAAEISGPEIPSVLLKILLREKIKNLAETIFDPGQIINQLNKNMLPILKEYQSFITTFYGFLDSQKVFSFCNAGCHAFVVKRDVSAIKDFTSQGFLIGIIEENSAFLTSFEELEKGDQLFLFFGSKNKNNFKDFLTKSIKNNFGKSLGKTISDEFKNRNSDISLFMFEVK